MARFIVAVSGGVDSAVLLHLLTTRHEHELFVAHFDHGIRPESDADARFVEALTAAYELPFMGVRQELGPKASEDQARKARYGFLRELAEKHQAKIMTAHHSNDIIETIAINLIRGTGWRGLAVLDNAEIERPLLGWTKQKIYEYALAHNLEWVEDETNASDAYLRNRVRRKTGAHPSDPAKRVLIELWEEQKALKHEIDQELAMLSGKKLSRSRYFFTHIDDEVAIELLRFVAQLTRPQAARSLHAIKTARAGAMFDVGGGQSLRLTPREFTVKSS